MCSPDGSAFGHAALRSSSRCAMEDRAQLPFRLAARRKVSVRVHPRLAGEVPAGLTLEPAFGDAVRPGLEHLVGLGAERIGTRMADDPEVHARDAPILLLPPDEHPPRGMTAAKRCSAKDIRGCEGLVDEPRRLAAEPPLPEPVAETHAPPPFAAPRDRIVRF